MEKEWKRKKVVSRAIIFAIALIMVLPAGFTLFTGSATSAPSQQVVDRYHMPPAMFYKGNTEIKLGDYSFDTSRGADVPDALKIDSYPSWVRGRYLVQMNDRITANMKAQLLDAGAEIGEYVPYNTFIVKMNAETKDRVADLPFVQSINIYQPEYKAPKSLWDMTGVLNDPNAANFLKDSYSDIRNAGVWDAAKELGKQDGKWITIKVWTGENENPYDVAALIAKGGGEVTDISKGDMFGFVTARVNVKGIPVLAYLNNVEYVHQWTLATIALADTVWTEQSKQSPNNEYDTCVVWNHGITGAGITIGDADTGLDTDHEMFYDPNHPNYGDYGSQHRKVQAYHVFGDNHEDLNGGSGHGTHTCGDAAGWADPTGSTNANRKGNAYEARLSFCDVGQSDDGSGSNDNTLGGIPSDLCDLFQPQYDDGARITTNSWGVPVKDANGNPTNAEGTYTGNSATSDLFMWQHKDFQVFFAAGNDRGETPGTGPMTVTPPSTGKNLVCVGSHGTGSNWDDISSFSSFGPTRDGRLKPDLASTGEDMDSADGTDWNTDGQKDTKYQNMQGTSMATPTAAGGGALVMQYFKDGYYPVNSHSPVAENGFEPSAALVKACLINGARDSTGGSRANDHPYSLNGFSMDYPNNDQGWGMTDTGDSLYFYDEKDSGREMRVQDFQTGLVTGQSITYHYHMESDQPVEITLVWTDYPGNPATDGALVNDLDLTVQDPAGNTYWGNNYGSSSRESNASNPAGRDHTNNVECALVKSPTAGDWTITINGTNVPIGPQPFALVVTGDFDDSVAELNLDKIVYGAPGDTVSIEVVDPDQSGSVSVMLQSSFGDFENITLAEVGTDAGRFTGTIQTDMWTANHDDGKIQVDNEGTITVSYDDASSGLTISQTADIVTTTPAISDVYVTDISNLVAVVHWTTDIPATSHVYYGDSPSLGSDTAVDTDLVTQHTVYLSGLSGFTDYYFDVESASQVGNTVRDDNGESHYRFTTVDNPDVLVIQEDMDIDSSHLRVSDWDLSLSNYGWSYSHWETLVYGLPTLDALNSAKVVLWDVGEGYPQIGADERAVIQSWIDQDGVQRLYINGQDIGWDMADSSGTDQDANWYHNYLHASFKQDDADGGSGDEGGGGGGIFGGGGGTDPFRIVGTSHQISTDFTSSGTGNNEQDLEQDIYGDGRFWPDDISNDQGGDSTAPWDYNAHDGSGDCAAISYHDTSYRLVYEAFTHFMIQDDDTFGTSGHVFGQDVDPNRAYIADQSLIYLLGEDHPDVHVTAPNGGETLSGTTTITWEVPSGGTAASTYDVLISADGGQSYMTEASGLSGSTTSYSWDTTSYLNGDTYRVKIVGHGTSLQGSDVSDANFTIDNGLSGDWEGPVVLAGSIHSDPEPVQTGDTFTITATADDSTKGDSNIADVEYFIDTAGTNGSGIHMSAADGSFDSVREDTTWTGTAPSAGNHTILVHAKDAANNWGGFTSLTIHVLPGPGYDIPVHAGWNLISFPVTASGDIESVLNDDNVVWDYAQWYDVQDSGDHWKTHVIGRSMNDLSDVDNTRGIWLHVTDAGDGFLTVSAATPSSTSIPLHAGWNLVGYPASGAAAMDSAGLPSEVTKIAEYDSGATYLVSEVSDWSASNFVPGQGYWLYSTADTTWTVTY